MRTGPVVVAAIIVPLLAGCLPSAGPCQGPLVLAASDLREALPELAEHHRQATGCAPVLSFGSSGQLAAQIEQGARADLFFSANTGFIDRLEAQDLLVAGTRRTYGIGRLVVVHAEGVPRLPFEALADDRLRHLAIAHPEHAPYGMAAREALRSAGLWQAVGPRVVHGNDVVQALQHVRLGNAEAGLVALALVPDTPPEWWVDAELHAPLRQVAAVPAAASDPAGGLALLELVVGPVGREVLARHGFELPERP